MSTVIINSEVDEFEENIFYISQAQRLFVNHCLEKASVENSWLEEYIEDLYLDSINNEFKSFYLDDEDYEIYSDKSKQNHLVQLLDESISRVKKMTQIEMENYLKRKNKLDAKYSDILDVSSFLKDYFREGEEKEVPYRVIFVLYNVLKLVKKESPVTIDKLKNIGVGKY